MTRQLWSQLLKFAEYPQLLTALNLLLEERRRAFLWNGHRRGRRRGDGQGARYQNEGAGGGNPQLRAHRTEQSGRRFGRCSVRTTCHA